jgi:recombinational DNA repair protein RecR
MVVEKDVDFENIVKTGEYGGKFFILGGTIPILEREPTKRIRAKQLIEIVDRNKDIEEIILALSVNPEGENTLQYVRKILEPLAEKHNIKITALGRGLSTGTELEYSDSDTLQNALKNRG